jgi:hypothetical protein
MPFAPALAKLRYQPEVEFMRLFVAACSAMHFDAFKPQELAIVINGEYVCVRLRSRSSTVCRSDVTPVRDRPCDAGVQT